MRSNLKTYLLSSAVAAFAAPAAFAGGPGPVVVPPAPVVVPVAAPLVDWSGFYGGLSYSKTMGNVDDGTTKTDLHDGRAPGIFAGYNWQSGNVVFGGELAYHGMNDTYIEGLPTDKFKNSVDLKGRVGYAAGRIMPYLTIGYSSARAENPTDTYNFTGVNYGLGVDYLATDNIFVGAEYLRRNLSNDTLNTDAKLSTFGIRVGYKF